AARSALRLPRGARARRRRRRGLALADREGPGRGGPRAAGADELLRPDPRVAGPPADRGRKGQRRPRELPPRAAVPGPAPHASRGPPRAGRAAAVLMKTVATVDYVVIAVYMLLMVAIGVYAARFNRDASDYFRGANRIPWLVAGLSSFMSGFSAWTFT